MKTVSKMFLTILAILAFVAFIYILNSLFSTISVQQANTQGSVASAKKKTPTIEVPRKTRQVIRPQTPAIRKTNPAPSPIATGSVPKLHVVNERKVDDLLQCEVRVAVSPDRKSFVCGKVRGGRGVWLGSFENGLTKQIADKEGYVQWFPNGKRIAYTIGVPIGKATKLYEIDLATGDKIEVGQTRDARNFSVDRNGQIFFLGREALTVWNSQTKTAKPVTELNARLAGIDQTAFTVDPLRFDSALFLSPDGERIVIQDVYDDKGSLILTDLSTGNVVTLTDEVGNATSPIAWSPDTSQVAYSSRTERDAASLEFKGAMLWVTDAIGNNPQEVFRTDQCVDLRYVTWLPNGQTILFVCTEGGNSFEVYWHYMALNLSTGTADELFMNGEGLDLVNDGLDILILRSVQNTGNWIIELSE